MTPPAPAPTPLNTLWLGNSLLGTRDAGGVNGVVPYMVTQIAESLGQAHTYKRQTIGGANLDFHWNSGTPSPDDIETELATGSYDAFVMQEFFPIAKQRDMGNGVLRAGQFHDLYTAAHSSGRSIYMETGCAAFNDGSNGTAGEDFSAPNRDSWRKRVTEDAADWAQMVTDVNATRGGQAVDLELFPLITKYVTALEDALPLGGFADIASLFRDGTHPSTELYYFYALAFTAELFNIDVRGAAFSFDSEGSTDGTPMNGLPTEAVATAMQNIVHTAWSAGP